MLERRKPSIDEKEKKNREGERKGWEIKKTERWKGVYVCTLRKMTTCPDLVSIEECEHVSEPHDTTTVGKHDLTIKVLNKCINYLSSVRSVSCLSYL